MHDPNETLHAILNVHEGSGLLSVTPDFNFATVGCLGNLSANCSRRLFPSAVVSPKRTVNVVEPYDSGFQVVVVPEVPAELLGVKLLPSITRLRLGGIGVLFFERGHLGALLFVLRVDTRGRRAKESRDPVQSSWLAEC